MKKTLFILFFIAANAASAQYKATDQGSTLTFKIGNFGFNVTGTFTGFEGTINFDPQNSANSNFNVSINASTVNTDNSLRDKHLKEDGYFDIKDYPKIHLASNKVTTAKNGQFILTGQLTIKGKSKAISFPFSASALNDGYVFKASFKINRKDFGVGGTSTISNELEVNLNVHATKPAV